MSIHTRLKEDNYNFRNNVDDEDDFWEKDFEMLKNNSKLLIENKSFKPNIH